MGLGRRVGFQILQKSRIYIILTMSAKEVLQVEKCTENDKLRMGSLNVWCINMSLGIWLDVSGSFRKGRI